MASSKGRYAAVLPNLTDGFWLATSPVDPTYNCIAWAADDNENWWWPSGCPEDYWPPGAPLENTVEAFIIAYGTRGYVPCGMDSSYESGFEKVALYASERFGTLKPQHAARQLDNGCWTSKLGPEEDIEHHMLMDVESPVYGKVVCILKRPKP